MCLKPVFAPSAICFQGDVHAVCFLHFFDDDLLHAFFFFRIDAEVQFVVYLQNHFRQDSLSLEATMDAYHRHLYYIGCRALNRCIYGVALCKATHRGVMGIDVGKIASAMEQCFGIAHCTCPLDALVHIFLHLGEGLEVTGNQLFSLVAAYLQTLCQSEHSDAVDDAEVGALGLRSLVARYVIDCLLYTSDAADE